MPVTQVSLRFNSSRYPLYQLVQGGLAGLIPQVRQQVVAGGLAAAFSNIAKPNLVSYHGQGDILWAWPSSQDNQTSKPGPGSEDSPA